MPGEDLRSSSVRGGGVLDMCSDEAAQRDTSRASGATSLKPFTANLSSSDSNDSLGGENVAIQGHVFTKDILDRLETRAEGDHGNPNEFVSNPAPPLDDLWDTDELEYLDLVKCRAWLRLTNICPKSGLFEGTLKCHWMLRTQHLHDRTEPRVRVPGIRMPRLVCNVEESRVWREVSHDTPQTMAWQGTSLFSFSGYEIFEVREFPFDRQIINMGMLEFVWRSDKDASTHEQTMKIAVLKLETISMSPEWDPHHAILEPRIVTGNGPDHVSRVLVKLRIERKPEYYIHQIFLMSYTIFVAALLPMSFTPGKDYIGDRLALHAAGLLTLVAFRFGIANDLPVVPYETFTSKFLNSQIRCLVLVMFEGVVAYKLVEEYTEVAGKSFTLMLGRIEDIVLVLLILVWGLFIAYCSLLKQGQSWLHVFENQLNGVGATDDLSIDFFDTHSFVGVCLGTDKGKGVASWRRQFSEILSTTNIRRGFAG